MWNVLEGGDERGDVWRVVPQDARAIECLGQIIRFSWLNPKECLIIAIHCDLFVSLSSLCLCLCLSGDVQRFFSCCCQWCRWRGRCRSAAASEGVRVPEQALPLHRILPLLPNSIKKSESLFLRQCHANR